MKNNRHNELQIKSDSYKEDNKSSIEDSSESVLSNKELEKEVFGILDDLIAHNFEGCLTYEEVEQRSEKIIQKYIKDNG